MAKTIRPADLGAAIQEELALYGRQVIEGVNAAGEEAMKELVRQTKAKAPKRSGAFKRAITYTVREIFTGDKTFIWGAKAPHHRLVHLLVRGHAKSTGGRVPGNPFLEDALEQVLPEYERSVEEVITNGS